VDEEGDGGAVQSWFFCQYRNFKGWSF
jgi:hypothetical protein